MTAIRLRIQMTHAHAFRARFWFTKCELAHSHTIVNSRLKTDTVRHFLLKSQQFVKRDLTRLRTGSERSKCSAPGITESLAWRSQNYSCLAIFILLWAEGFPCRLSLYLVSRGFAQAAKAIYNYLMFIFLVNFLYFTIIKNRIDLYQFFIQIQTTNKNFLKKCGNTNLFLIIGQNDNSKW